MIYAALACTFVATIGVYVYLSLRHSLLSPISPYLTSYAIAYGVYVYVGLRLLPYLTKSPRVWIPLILASGIVFRMLLVDMPPSLSTDIYRYVWDGRLIVHGINPYKWAPFDPRLAQFRDAAIWYKMDYKYYDTIYMPVSQAVFAIAYLLGGTSLAAYKLCYVLFDAGVMALIVMILRERKLPLANVYWYAWCPLPITEVGIAGHQDVVGTFCMLLGVLLLLRRNPLKSSVLLVAAGFTKGFAFLVLPVLVSKYGKQLAYYSIIALAVFGLPIWMAFGSFKHGMMQYLGTVHVNSGLFHFVYTAFRMAAPVNAYLITTWIGRLAMVGIIGWSIKTPVRSDQDLLRRATLVVAGTLLVVPTLFPWYILWLLPLALILRPKPAYSFVALSGSVALMYLYYYDYTLLWWVRALEYVPFYYILWREVKSGFWSAHEGLDGATGGAGASPCTVTGSEVAVAELA